MLDLVTRAERFARLRHADQFRKGKTKEAPRTSRKAHKGNQSRRDSSKSFSMIDEFV